MENHSHTHAVLAVVLRHQPMLQPYCNITLEIPHPTPQVIFPSLLYRQNEEGVCKQNAEDTTRLWKGLEHEISSRNPPLSSRAPSPLAADETPDPKCKHRLYINISSKRSLYLETARYTQHVTTVLLYQVCICLVLLWAEMSRPFGLHTRNPRQLTSGWFRRISLGWLGFLVVCFLYTINPNPRRIICCGKTWPTCHF